MADGDQFDNATEQGMLLALVPLAKDIADYVTSRIPPGTHFGVMLLTNSVDAAGLARVVAVSSDRNVVAPAVAQWALTVMQDDSDHTHEEKRR